MAKGAKRSAGKKSKEGAKTEEKAYGYIGSSTRAKRKVGRK